MHEAGQESAFAALQARRPPPSEEFSGLQIPTPERGAASLLDDCLRQTYAALHLSLSRREQEGAVELQALARLISGEAPFARAENWANEIIANMMGDTPLPLDRLGDLSLSEFGEMADLDSLGITEEEPRDVGYGHSPPPEC